MTTPSSVIFVDDGGAIGRHPFWYDQRGTTFVQPQAMLRSIEDTSTATVDNIENAKGEWRDVPVCVRDTILRLLRSAEARQKPADPPSVRNVSSHGRLSARSTPRPSSQPTSARGEQRRTSFIAAEGLPRRRTPTTASRSSSASRAAKQVPQPADAPHLSPMVERVLARASSPQRGAASPARGSPPKIGPNNSPFGHPYESPMKATGKATTESHLREPANDNAGAKTVTPRRSPTRHCTATHEAWRPAGVVQPYEPIEPCGPNDGRSSCKMPPKKLRSLALSNLMTFHRGVERMKADHASTIAAQLMTAMQHQAKKPTPAATQPRVPTVGQVKALEDVGYLLKALSDAAVELVAQFATDEEKRYLGLHSHRYQTRAERQSEYQYTNSAVERKLKMLEDFPGAALRKTGSYSEHIAQEAARQRVEGHGSASFGPDAESPGHQPPPRLPSKAMMSPLKSPQSAAPCVPLRHSSSSSLRKATQDPFTDFAVTNTADAETHDGTESTATADLDSRRSRSGAAPPLPQSAQDPVLPAASGPAVSREPQASEGAQIVHAAQSRSVQPDQQPAQQPSRNRSPTAPSNVRMVKKIVPAAALTGKAPAPAATHPAKDQTAIAPAQARSQPAQAPPAATQPREQPAPAVTQPARGQAAHAATQPARNQPAPAVTQPARGQAAHAATQPANLQPLTVRRAEVVHTEASTRATGQATSVAQAQAHTSVALSDGGVRESERGTSVSSQATARSRRLADLSHLKVKDSDEDSEEDV